jgi:purine-binding chemotaxis protein CheW
MSAVVQKSRAAHAPGLTRYLTLTLGQELYAINALRVREIIRPLEVSPVPNSPRHLLGMINLRGKIVPVVDLRIKFSLKFTGRTDRTCVIVVESGSDKRQIGLMVDEVQEVLTLNHNDVEEAPSFGFALDLACIQGIAKVKDSVMILLDLDRLLIEPQASPVL